MNTDWDLIKRKLEGSTTDQDELLIKKWLDASRQHQVLLSDLMERWGCKEQGESFETEAAYLRFKAREEALLPKRIAPAVPIWRIMAVAASAALLVLAGWWFWGGQSAAPDAVRYLTRVAGRGQKLTIGLPDGSKVKLNAESSVTYPETFTGAATREVQMTGEAFFEVEPNASQPFTTRSGELLTTVLGTSFNIRAYPDDEAIEVTVATGQVKIEAEDTRGITNVRHLTPGDQGLFNRKTSMLMAHRVNPDTAIAWKKGILMFENNTLTEIVPELERWYGVKISLKDKQPDGCKVRLAFDNLSLTQALEMLTLTTGIKYRSLDNGTYQLLGVCKN